MKSFSDKDVDVIGVSGDSVKTQEAFKKANKLGFTLLADEKGDVAKAFGVPTSKGGTAKAKVDDKEQDFVRALTIKRWTFVIDKAGKVAYKNEVKAAADDSKAVLAVIEKLK
jgi:thioredoxin-dependent peroxiredoxin